MADIMERCPDLGADLSQADRDALRALRAQYDPHIARLEQGISALARIRDLGNAFYIASRAFIDYRGDNPETNDRLCTASAEARKAFYAACEREFAKP